MMRIKAIPGKLRMALLAGLTGLLVICSTAYIASDFEIVKNLDIFASTIRQLNQNYVDPIKPGELTRNAIESMLGTLDPYTNYIGESDIEEFRFMQTGQYGGIGAGVHIIDKYFVITEIYENYPAHKAGLVAGDIILEVNGREIKGRSVEEVGSLMKGQTGSSVELLIRRAEKGEEFIKDVERTEVKIENIPYHGMIDATAAYIRLEGFTQNAAKEVYEVFLEMKQEHPEMKGLILDLRGNGGGLLHEAVAIVDLFVGKGNEVVRTRGRTRERSQIHRTTNPAFDPDIPLVILVDKRSASSSEIVAGAIQDLDRGIVVGQSTFGKGLVQNVVPLSYNSQLKITVAKYYIPSGRSVQAVDYSQQNEQRHTTLPDSLRVAYKTKNGRIVYDGRGIDPDIYIEPYQLAPVSKTLLNRYHIFNYATKFCEEFDTIEAADKFQISERIYRDFVNYLSGVDYEYQTQTEMALQKFQNIALQEGYFNFLDEDYRHLSMKMQKKKDEDLETFRDEIVGLLRDELVRRYYFQRGRIISKLNHDPEIKYALEVISNRGLYDEYLKPGTEVRGLKINMSK